jgi:hypothetical protein
MWYKKLTVDEKVWDEIREVSIWQAFSTEKSHRILHKCFEVSVFGNFLRCQFRHCMSDNQGDEFIDNRVPNMAYMNLCLMFAVLGVVGHYASRGS